MAKQNDTANRDKSMSPLTVCKFKRKGGSFFPLADKDFRQSQERQPFEMLRDVCSDSFLETFVSKKSKLDEKKDITNFSQCGYNRDVEGKRNKFVQNESGMTWVKNVSNIFEDSGIEPSTNQREFNVFDENKPVENNGIAYQETRPYLFANDMQEYSHPMSVQNNRREHFYDTGNFVSYPSDVLNRSSRIPAQQPLFHNDEKFLNPAFKFRPPLREIQPQMRQDVAYERHLQSEADLFRHQNMGNMPCTKQRDHYPSELYNRNFVAGENIEYFDDRPTRQSQSKGYYLNDVGRCFYPGIPPQNNPLEMKQFMMNHYFSSMQ